MASKPPIERADIAAWLLQLETELLNERAAITGIEVTAQTAKDATAKSFDEKVTSVIAATHATTAIREFTTFDLLDSPDATYGVPSTKNLSADLLAEIQKTSGSDMRLIAQYLIQLNTLESFRKTLATKNAERIHYMRARQANASQGRKLLEVLRLSLQNQDVGIGAKSPQQARKKAGL